MLVSRPQISVHRAELAAKSGDVIPFFAFPVAVRRIIYTTNAIEFLLTPSSGARGELRGHFPTDEAAIKMAVDLDATFARHENAATRSR